MSACSEDPLNDLLARLDTVRRWLLVLKTLRATVVWLIVLSLYADFSMLADHHLHFGPAERAAILGGFLILLAILLYRLVRIRREVSYTQIANHVESVHSFDQQLVAAAEYCQKSENYPYSKRLARQLVLNLNEASRDFAFDSTVDKRRVYVLAGCIAIYLIIVSLFTCHYARAFGSSVTETIPPAADAQPTPASQEAQAATGTTPGIEEMMATVNTGKLIEEQTQKVNDFALEVLPGSTVELLVKATTPLQEATIGGIEEAPIMRKPDGGRDFRLSFKVDKPLILSFHLVSAEGKANTAPLTMQVRLKADTPPQFKLLSPDGDCAATDVASIPICFEVSDDFGLDQAQLCCQMPRGGTIVLDSNSPRGALQSRLSAVLELEQYDLKVGDTVLFYARARDIVTGFRPGDPNTSNEIYFVEIRPYHQYWHPQASSDSPNRMPGKSPEDLMTILEYTRSIVKRTWALAQTPPGVQRQQGDFEKLCADTGYCEERLANLRDDPDNRFSAAEKAALTNVMSPYGRVKSSLAVKDAGKAVEPAQEAYRLLRRLVDELNMKWNPPDSGQSVPEDKPERVKLQEQPHSPEQDRERAESQLEKAQNQVDSLTRQEKALKTDLAKAMQKAGGQKSEDGGQQSDGKGQQPGGQPSQGNAEKGSNGEGGQSAMDATLRMLGARQNALRQQASQLSNELAKSTPAASSDQTAKQHLDQAVEDMKQLEDRLAEARYSPESSAKREPNIAGLAESATRELGQAGQAIDRALSSARSLTDAQKAEAMARQLSKDAEAFDASVSPEQKQEMMNRLKAAEQLLEKMAKPQSQVVSGPGGGSGSQGYTRNATNSPGETARMLSRQFWSVAIAARDRRMHVTEDEPADARFFESENKFFENAAKFKPQQSSK